MNLGWWWGSDRRDKILQSVYYKCTFSDVRTVPGVDVIFEKLVSALLQLYALKFVTGQPGREVKVSD